MIVLNRKEACLVTDFGQPVREAVHLWLDEAGYSEWRSIPELQELFPKAQPIGSDRMMFPIAGGVCKLLVAFHFEPQIAYIKFFGGALQQMLLADTSSGDVSFTHEMLRASETGGKVKADMFLEVLQQVGRFFDSPFDAIAGADQLRLLRHVSLLHAYETEHFPLIEASPIARLEYIVDQHGLTPEVIRSMFASKAAIGELLTELANDTPIDLPGSPA